MQEIADFLDDQPLYLTTQNSAAAISTGANLLRPSPYSLSGGGVTVGMWDSGAGRSSHQEFDGRMVVIDGAASTDHATHVGGTMIASGAVASARGMASPAKNTTLSFESTGDYHITASVCDAQGLATGNPQVRFLRLRFEAQ